MTCTVPDCTRASCRPEPYQPLCSRHYLAMVNTARRDAAARFAEHVAELEGARA